ncbi:MAG: TIGR03560 family F420-dependent LLM class oxidoreductase, partial [Anaerolineae bacterium]|nr:TIGR03560 family F420-dependent LLM class oxidoreductase [Anaerolineae bacterium]
MTDIGLMIEGQHGLNWPRWQKVLQTAEDCGYQCVFRSDHYTDAVGEDLDSLELWVSLTYAATHTRHLEFGSLVAPTTFRHPALNARMAAQVDDLSGGRLVFGLGAGWQEREHRKFGIPFYDFTRRYEMLSDALEMTRRLFDSDAPVFFEGQHFQLQDARLLPRPARPGGPPILIGGRGPNKTLPLAARYAAEWNAVFTSLSDFVPLNRRMDELLAERGRTPDSLKRSLMTQVIYGATDARLSAKLAQYGATAEELWARRGFIAGTGRQIIDRLAQFAEAGIQRFMLQWLDLDD